MKLPLGYGKSATTVSNKTESIKPLEPHFLQIDEKSRAIVISLSVYESLIRTIEIQARTIEEYAKGQRK